MAFDHWISSHMAATLLGVTPEAVSKMYREGRVKRRWEPDAGKPYAPVYYSWAEICRLKETSSRVRRRKKLPRKEECEPPEPVWMTTQEAARFLEVDLTRIWILIKRGRFQCRREGGHQRCKRAYVLKQEVETYRYDTERVKNRKAYEAHRYRPQSLPNLSETERAELRKKEWLTAAEAARFLGIAPVTLYGYRAAGRIPGYRLQEPLRSGLRMVFRREDIEALDNDPKHRAYQARWRAAHTEAVLAEKESEHVKAALAVVRRVQGWDREDYEPAYQGSPGSVW